TRVGCAGEYADMRKKVQTQLCPRCLRLMTNWRKRVIRSGKAIPPPLIKKDGAWHDNPEYQEGRQSA
ncbi:MAG: hypothetical protein C0622_05180, partial [Desulfuromonas sp.]